LERLPAWLPAISINIPQFLLIPKYTESFWNEKDKSLPRYCFQTMKDFFSIFLFFKPSQKVFSLNHSNLLYEPVDEKGGELVAPTSGL